MEFHREAPVRLLHLGLRRVPADSEHLVVVSLRHPRPHGNGRARSRVPSRHSKRIVPTRSLRALLLVVLDLFELRVDDVVVLAPGRAAAARLSLSLAALLRI